MTSSSVRPVEIGSNKQLFIDHRFIESSYGVKLSMNPPVKAEAVLVAETPIEGHRIGVFSTVIEADERYLMYYDAIPNSAVDDNGVMICLAGDSCVCGIRMRAAKLYAFQFVDVEKPH